MGRLTDKVVFITGTGGGQGRVAAQLFAQEGAHIIGCDINEAGSAETVELVRAAGGRIDATAPVDLSDFAAAGDWIEWGLDITGRIDVLYNNASAPMMNLIGEMTPDEWSFTIRNELDLIFNTVRAAWSSFVKQGGGAIINVASLTGHMGYGGIGQTAHAAAKGGVIGMTKQLAAEGAPLDIRANSISPGPIGTPALMALPEEQLEGLKKMVPLGRLGLAEDIVYFALYLASDEANWVTGSDFLIDGGRSSIITV